MPQLINNSLSNRPLAPQLWPAVSRYIPWFSRALWPLVHQPLGGSPTLRPTHAEPLFPRSYGPNCDGNPPTLSALLTSPPNSCSHIVALSAPPLYIASHGPALLSPASSAPLISPPSVSNTSASCDTWTPNSYFYTRCCGQVKERHLQVLPAPYLPKWRPYFPQKLL